MVVADQPLECLHKYRPDLVIATHAIYAVEQTYIREAKRLNITTMSIVNSWDNLTVYKGTLRVLPDYLIVPNEIVKGEAIDLGDMEAKKVIIIGMWNCDHYARNKPSRREDFCRSLGLNPAKPYLLFASIGKNFTDTEWQDISILLEAMNDGKLTKNFEILIRYHPDLSSPFVWGKLKRKDGIFVQQSSTPINDISGTKFPYEITSLDDQNALDAIYHSALVITVQSTISIEVAVLNKPIINICFDGWEKRSYYHPYSVVRYHDFTHYLPVHQSGGVRLVKTPKELILAVKDYLENPNLDQNNRHKLAEIFCWRLDGGAVLRLAKLIHEVLVSQF